MSSWHSYPSIYNMGHRAIADLLTHYVNVEEKVDGSQFSFGLVPASGVDIDYPGMEKMSLKVRSKGAVMHPDAPEALFKEAVETVKRLAAEGLLTPGWTYRGECLKKPKHNALAYDRVPNGNIIIFDINDGEESYLQYPAKKAEAERLGLECVPLLFSGKMESIEQFRSYLGTVSVLGGQTIEGVVVKPVLYNVFGLDKKVLMGKFVSEVFKEVHRKAWGESNPAGKDIIGQIGDVYRHQARWSKAVQHLREAGLLKEDVTDIGMVIREIPEDIKKEHEDEIKETLFKWAWPHIRRAVTRGLPEWYKEKLLARQFEVEQGYQAKWEAGEVYDAAVPEAPKVSGNTET